MIGYLLWTERPQLLPREVPTHDWMLERRPWETFALELVHDNQPGDWRRYSQIFHETWTLALRTHQLLINVESDVLPTMQAFQQVLECPHPVCVVPYELFPKSSLPRRWGATIESRCPGGWDAHFAAEGEEWAHEADLGFAKFRPSAELPDGTHLKADTEMLNAAVFRTFRSKDPRDVAGRIHLHWPGLKNNHLTWDAGDFAHWPRGEWEKLAKIHERDLDPSFNWRGRPTGDP